MENKISQLRRQIEDLKAENLWLRRSEDETVYRSLFENNHAVMLLIDPETAAIKDANLAACAYYGWSRKQLKALRIDAINTLSREEVYGQMQLARAEKRRNFFFKHRRADGSIRDVEVYSGPLTVKGQTLLYSIIHDITDRRQIEEAHRRSEEKFRLAFHTSPDSINLNRLSDGKYIEINEGFTKLTGYTREDVIGKSSIDLNIWYDPKDRQRLVKVLQNEGYVENLEARFRRKNGEIGVGLMSARVLKLNQEDVILSITRDITEREQFENALRESEDKYSQLIESLTDAILVWSGVEIIYANPAALKLFRVKQPADLIGKRYLDFVHPDDRPESAERIKKSKNEKWIAPRREHRMIAADGQIIHVESTGVPIQIQGQIQHLGIFSDISERKHAEEKLRESEERMRITIEAAQIGTYMTDLEANKVHWSPELCDILGVQPRIEITNEEAYKVVHKDDIERVLEIGRRGLDPNGDGSFFSEHRVVRPDGQVRWILWRGRTIFRETESGRIPSKRIGACVDITDRVQAQELLAESERRLATLMANLPGMAYRCLNDDFWTMKFVSDGCLDLTGFSADHLLENRLKNYVELIHPEDLKMVREQVESSLERRSQFNRTYRICTAGGEEKWVLEKGQGVFSGSGELSAIEGFITDITEHKQAGQQREKLEAQLRQAQKMEAIGSLAGGIAHDFNNILGVIIGNAEILKMTDISFSSKDEVDQILAASKRARDLVRQILAFSRQGEQQKILMSLKPVVKETIEFLRASIPSSIQLKHYINPDAGTIMADPTQMQQVLMNLCTNAAQAMEKEGGVLRVELDNIQLSEKDKVIDPEAEPGTYLRITVSDTGHGIAQEVLPRIFDPYFTTKGPDKGTGLGLAVVHGIVRSHGGIVKVYSEVGKGTAFHVFFQRSDGAVKKEEKAEQKLPIGTERILVVDDEIHLLEMYQRMLGMLGYQVDTRSSPIEATEALRSNLMKYDLVLTDMTMPQMNGYNLAKKIMEIRPGLPVVLCTGFSDQINEEKARSAGILGFLLKPVLFHDLANTLRKALDDSNKKRSS